MWRCKENNQKCLFCYICSNFDSSWHVILWLIIQQHFGQIFGFKFRRYMEKVQNSASICFTIIILHCQIEQCHSNGSYAAKVLTATIIWETRVTFATRLHNFHCCGIVPFGSVKLKRLSVIDSCDRQITGHISWLHSWHYVNFVLMLWFW